MTTFEKCQMIRMAIINRAAEVMAYNWGNDFAAKQIREIPEELESSRKELIGINPCDLTEDQMTNLGFCRWREDRKMMLIPLWLLPFLVDEFDSECINGEKITHKAHIDNDNRCGCLAYGVFPKS